jgi:hypothetical protein
MRNRAEKGSTKVTVELQTPEPFMILFKEVPKNLIEFKDLPGQPIYRLHASYYPITQVQQRIST